MLLPRETSLWSSPSPNDENPSRMIEMPEGVAGVVSASLRPAPDLREACTGEGGGMGTGGGLMAFCIRRRLFRTGAMPS